MGKKIKKTVTVDGCMTFGKLEEGLRTADFQCCEEVTMEPLSARCKVNIERDGNVYITELPKRVKNTPIFRDDNCSFSKGKDGKYYFYFLMPEELLDELPGELVRQASAIAQKVIREILIKGEII